MEYNTMTHAAKICTDGLKKIKGRKIILKDYPELNCYSYNDGFLSHVCEYESGRSLGTGLNLEMAIEKAIKNISNAGMKKVKAMIANSIKQYGYANQAEVKP